MTTLFWCAFLVIIMWGAFMALRKFWRMAVKSLHDVEAFNERIAEAARISDWHEGDGDLDG